MTRRWDAIPSWRVLVKMVHKGRKRRPRLFCRHRVYNVETEASASAAPPDFSLVPPPLEGSIPEEHASSVEGIAEDVVSLLSFKRVGTMPAGAALKYHEDVPFWKVDGATGAWLSRRGGRGRLARDEGAFLSLPGDWGSEDDGPYSLELEGPGGNCRPYSVQFPLGDEDDCSYRRGYDVFDFEGSSKDPSLLCVSFPDIVADVREAGQRRGSLPRAEGSLPAESFPCCPEEDRGSSQDGVGGGGTEKLSGDGRTPQGGNPSPRLPSEGGNCFRIPYYVTVIDVEDDGAWDWEGTAPTDKGEATDSSCSLHPRASSRRGHHRRAEDLLRRELHPGCRPPRDLSSELDEFRLLKWRAQLEGQLCFHAVRIELEFLELLLLLMRMEEEELDGGLLPSKEGRSQQIGHILKSIRDATEAQRRLEQQHEEVCRQLQEQQQRLRKAKTSAERQRIRDLIESVESRMRELKKRSELQGVLHEELMLDLAAIKKGFACQPGGGGGGGNTVDHGARRRLPSSSNHELPSALDMGIDRVNHLADELDRKLDNVTGLRHELGMEPPPPQLNGGGPRGRSGQVLPAPPLRPLPDSSTEGCSQTDLPGKKHVATAPELSVVVPAKEEITVAREPPGASAHGNTGAKALPEATDLQCKIDMLEVPGIGRCYVYVAKYSYDPLLHSPNENPETELRLNEGDFILVWGEMDEDGYFDGELLDGRRGLVPSNFVEQVVGRDLIHFHQAVVRRLREQQERCGHPGEDPELDAMEELKSFLTEDFRRFDCYFFDIEDFEDHQQEPRNNEMFFSTLVEPPQQLVLERQLNKSVLLRWSPAQGDDCGIEYYYVYVDGILRNVVKATEKTRALVENIDLSKIHRVSVRSVTANRRTSTDAACTMIIGKRIPTAPTCVQASHITSTSAVITWLPSNSNYQHAVVVNNVEVRVLKPGVYRHTISGLTPDTLYKVTVRSKNIPPPGYGERRVDVPTTACVEFRTLRKGLPDSPTNVQVEPGPQDDTVLVTWQPVALDKHALASISAVVGYSVYMDGKKVADVDSPTGDHALIDIAQFPVPSKVTVRTRSKDGLSVDSLPGVVPDAMAGIAKGETEETKKPSSSPRKLQKPASKEKDHGKKNGVKETATVSKSYKVVSQEDGSHRRSNLENHVTLETEENLSDKEVYPQERRPIPSIEITHDTVNGKVNPSKHHHPDGEAALERVRSHHHHRKPRRHAAMEPVAGVPSSQAPDRHPKKQWEAPSSTERTRIFVALFDYDPPSMSPNPGACEEELPFREGDLIKIYGDKDPDGFFWGEANGLKGYVPCNMVSEVQIDDETIAQELLKEASHRGGKHDRWGDIYACMPVRKMVALYDYDPRELSPNVDAEVELRFRTGDMIDVYGDMDDDGFYMGELHGVRGLVPSNFLAEVPEYSSKATNHGHPYQEEHGDERSKANEGKKNSTSRKKTGSC